MALSWKSVGWGKTKMNVFCCALLLQPGNGIYSWDVKGNAWLCRGMGDGEKERKKPNYPPHSDEITAKTTMTSAIDLIREKGKK